MDKLRVTGWEKDMLVRLSVCYEILIHDVGDGVKKRVSLIPGGWRDLRLCQEKLRRLVDSIYRTIPQEQLYSLSRTLKDASYSVGVRGPVGRNRQKVLDEQGIFVAYGDINHLFEAAREGKCLTCVCDREGQARCELRKTLDHIPSDIEDREDGGCPYMDVTI